MSGILSQDSISVTEELWTVSLTVTQQLSSRKNWDNYTVLEQYEKKYALITLINP